MLFASSWLFYTSVLSFYFHVQHILYNFVSFQFQNVTQRSSLKFNFSLFFTLCNRPWLIFDLGFFCSISVQIYMLFPNRSGISFSCTDWSLASGQLHVHLTLPSIDNQISKPVTVEARPISTLKCTCVEFVEDDKINVYTHEYTHKFSHTHYIQTHTHTQPLSSSHTNGWDFLNVNKCYWVWNRKSLQIACFIPGTPKCYICIIVYWRLGRK